MILYIYKKVTDIMKIYKLKMYGNFWRKKFIGNMYTLILTSH